MTCKEILKILMVVFNGAIFLAGAAILVIGVLVEINRKHVLGVIYMVDIKDIPPQLAHLSNTGYLLIAVGAVLAFMGFLGCCGACCENKRMLMTFFIIILIVFVVEVVAAVLVLFYQTSAEKLLDKLRENVAKSIKETYGQDNIISNAWNETMSLMKCCGYNNYTDFTGSKFVIDTLRYPQFCCPTTPERCDIGKAASERVDGCFNAVVKLVNRHSGLLLTVAICVAVIEIAAMIMSLILYKK